MDKAKLRKEMIQTRLDLSSEKYTVKSNLIISKLKNHPDFINAKTIGIYIIDSLFIIQLTGIVSLVEISSSIKVSHSTLLLALNAFLPCCTIPR